jgi:HB1, ASXL, restriction endonuclease HTH domain
MKRPNVVGLLENVSAKELQSLIAAKKKLDTLQGRKKALEKEHASVSRQIDSLTRTSAKRPTARVKKAPKKSVKRPRRKRILQPSLSTVIVQVLEEKKRPMKINDIHDTLLKEKDYKTEAKNFKANVRILLYKNEKGFFKKVGPGRFALARAKKK